jgi:hypothetical protein
MPIVQFFAGLLLGVFVAVIALSILINFLARHRMDRESKKLSDEWLRNHGYYRRGPNQ